MQFCYRFKEKCCVETYKNAVNLHVSQDFIILLEKEIYSRVDQGLLNDIDEQDDVIINSI
ncbi:sporulation histidine kinase inhibitor Sda [Halalkalibacter kiskunsagensis]|uniref:Sporulation histidine kinase inhibitor Sda n=1 Tax=Halalkalibacter kiskunsagensis TaxID=1548599 RepID=A0ABV6KLM5_9BACI